MNFDDTYHRLISNAILLNENSGKFTNWTMPSEETLKREFLIEHEYKGNDFFESEDEFLQKVADASIVEITPEINARIGYRSNTDSYEELLGLIKTYRSYPEFRNEKSIQKIYDGFDQNDAMEYPIVIKFKNGSMRVFSGNTRMDIAFQKRINPKVLMVSANK